jgi:glycosyltransferase involved in cell wall biosynthesis
MRIQIIAHGLYPDVHAGVELLNHWLANALSGRGHDVVVTGPAKPSFIPPADAAYRCRGLEYPQHGYHGDPPQDYTRRVWQALAEGIERDAPEAILASSLVRLGWPILAKLEGAGVPFVAGLHDYWYLCPAIEWACGGRVAQCASRCQGASPSSPLQFARAAWTTRRRKRRVVGALNRASGPLVAPSRAAAAVYHACGVGRERTVVIPNGIELSGEWDSAARDAGDETTPRGPIRFGFVGRVAENKGVRVLVRAFQHVGDQPAATLDLWGGGPPEVDAGLLGYECDERIRFRGHYLRSELPRILRDVDVVVAPSTWNEPYGLVVQEALAAGRVVIASNIGGLAEQIDHGVNGLLVPAAEEAALARMMQSTAAKLSRGEWPLTERPRARSIEATADGYEQLLSACVERWPELKSSRVAAADLLRSPTDDDDDGRGAVPRVHEAGVRPATPAVAASTSGIHP